jgi:hypothetical protein
MFTIETKVSTAVHVPVFMRGKGSGNGVAGIGSALTIQIAKAGGAYATITPTVTDRGGGYYDLLLTTGHTDTLGISPIRVTATATAGKEDVIQNDECLLNVEAVDRLDAVRYGLSALPNVAAGALGGLASVAIWSGTAQSGGTNYIQLDAGARAIDDTYHRQIVTITGGTGFGQSRTIMRYIGSTRTAYVNHNWLTNPANDSVFQITAGNTVMLAEGLAQAGGATTITLLAGESSTTDFFKGAWIQIYSGTGQGQARLCTAYDGTTKIATVDTAWAVNPDSTSVYGILTGADVTASGITATADVNVTKWNGTAVPAPNVAGYPLVDAAKIVGGTIPAPNVTGVPIVDTKYESGTVQPAPTTAGIPKTEANVTKWNGTTVATPAVAGVPIVDTKYESGTIQATPTTAGIPKVETVSVTGLTLRTGTAQGAGTGNNQIQLDAGASATNDLYHRASVAITAGTGVGQTRSILHYVGSTKTATVDHNWSTNPDNTSVFAIMANASAQLVEGLAQAGAAGSITLQSTEPSTDDFYKGMWIGIASGTGQGQSRLCTGYTGSSKVATVTPNWATNPDSTSAYEMVNGADAGNNANITTIASRVTANVATASALASLAASQAAEAIEVDQIYGVLLAGVTVAGYASGMTPGGTLKPNTVIDNYTYDAGKRPTSWRTRVFATAGAADTAYTAVNVTTGQGHSDNTDSEIEREKYTAEYKADGTLISLKRHKDL